MTVPLLTKVLHDADPAVRTGALEILVEIGKPAVPALVATLEEQRATYWACLALSEIGPDAAEAVPALADVLKTDARPEVRREAALGLGSIGPGAAAAVPALTDALGDKESTVAAGAAFALGRIGPDAKSAEAALANAENSSDPFLRTVSAWALAKLDPQNQARQAAGRHGAGRCAAKQGAAAPPCGRPRADRLEPDVGNDFSRHQAGPRRGR